ncbi:MAG TPA: L,D-transpeptidase family protein [Caulobacteraceae bacterium]|nr:L,D-transpeptidase family protein [Caulobacteraceae bacterium]
MSSPSVAGPVTRRQSLGVYAAALLLAACGRSDPPARAATDVVGQGLSDPVARRFYELQGWRSSWTPALARSLSEALAGARAHGLDPHVFAPKLPAGDSAAADENLTLAALGYAKALAVGFVDPRSIEPVFTLARNQVDLAAGLAQALRGGGDIGAWLAGLAPSDAEYRALSAGYLAALGRTRRPAASARGAPPARSTASGDQARQFAVNLERRRWLVRDPPAHRIDVNTAAAFLDYLRPGAPVVALRTVVGRDDHPTPCIEAPFQRLIANPPWRVPTDIARREILPKGRRYLRREHMRWVGGRLEQAPGPRCALGRVKFDVEDPYEIYLHDTPSKSLFALRDRHRSHGCVRVENAVGLARQIAAETGKAAELDLALASRKTSEVELGQSIPVRMLYHTAYLGPAGKVVLVPDVYGTDSRLAAALGLGEAAAVARRREPSVFGP